MNATATRSFNRKLPESSHGFRTGFLAMLPLWAGAIPFGIAFGMAAREAGMSAFEAQLMSLTVFTAAAQVSAVSLIDLGASPVEILITTLVLNAHLPLIAATVARELRPAGLTRLGTAWLLTDGSFAIASGKPPLRLPVLIGAGVSMYAGWNLGTATGLIAGNAIPDPQALAIEFVVPLTFLAVLIPLVKSRTTLLVTVIAAAGTLLLASWLPVGFALLIAALTASLVGAFLSTPETERAQAGRIRAE